MGSALEAVPLPGFLKKRLMKILLRDVHHYLYDVEYSPRPGRASVSVVTSVVGHWMLCGRAASSRGRTWWCRTVWARWLPMTC